METDSTANQETESPSENTPARAAQPPIRPRWLLLLVLVLIATGAGLWSLRRPLPKVTRTELEQASRLWSESGPASYHVQVRVTGRQGARYDVRVRDGVVVEALRNGESLSPGPTLETWSVPGMFRTILLDVEGLERRSRGSSDEAAPSTSLLLRCEFEPERGIPLRYQRIEWGNGTTNPDASWTVDKFEITP